MPKATFTLSLRVPVFALCFCMGLALLGDFPAYCQGEPQATVDKEANSRQYLFGDWEGRRSDWEEHGVSFSASLISDLIANVRGGIKRGLPYWEHLYIDATVDTAKSGLWEGGTFYFLLNGDIGDKPTDYIGDFQWTNSWQGYNTISIGEAWYEHALLDGQASVLAGLHDWNTEFDLLRYGYFSLINSSFAASPELTQLYLSTYPLTALGLRLKYLPLDNFYIMTGLYDGIPGDPTDHHFTHINLERDDGIFTSLEAGVTPGEDAGYDAYYKAALGCWHNSAHFEDFAGEKRNNNSGFYAIAEKALFSEADSRQGLGAFLQSGFARADRNQVTSYFGAGLNYTGLFPRHDNDIAALGIAHARNGDRYIRAEDGRLHAETAVELTYKAEILPYLRIQPDIQWVINPGMLSTVSNALVIGMRVEVDL